MEENEKLVEYIQKLISKSMYSLPKMATLLFTYGTLRVNEPNAYIIKDNSEYRQTCKTVNKYIMITQKSKSFPFVFPVDYYPELEEHAVYITGDLYSVNSEGLELCDRLEGHPTWYQRTKIEVKGENNQIQDVEAYLLTKECVKEINMGRMILLKGDWKRCDSA